MVATGLTVLWLLLVPLLLLLVWWPRLLPDVFDEAAVELLWLVFGNGACRSMWWPLLCGRVDGAAAAAAVGFGAAGWERLAAPALPFSVWWAVGRGGPTPALLLLLPFVDLRNGLLTLMPSSLAPRWLLWLLLWWLLWLLLWLPWLLPLLLGWLLL